VRRWRREASSGYRSAFGKFAHGRPRIPSDLICPGKGDRLSHCVTFVHYRSRKGARHSERVFSTNRVATSTVTSIRFSRNGNYLSPLPFPDKGNSSLSNRNTGLTLGVQIACLQHSENLYSLDFLNIRRRIPFTNSLSLHPFGSPSPSQQAVLNLLPAC